MIHSAEYLENISCPVCGSNESEVLFPVSHASSKVLEMLQLEDANNKVNIAACRKCSHKYMSPVIKPGLMKKYYSILNSEFYDPNREVINYNVQEYEDYAKLIQASKKGGRVLEIGCGNGFLLKTLAGKGYDCYGVEPSPLAYEHAKSLPGLKVENKFLRNSSFYDLRFDIVIFIDVAEHILDMQSFMEEVKHVLNDGGLVFIGTGNIDSLNAKIAKENWNYFLSWEHVSFFNKKSMEYILTRNNFTNISIIETSLQHKPLKNIIEFGKNLFKKVVNPFLKTKYYHGITFDHFVVLATSQKDN